MFWLWVGFLCSIIGIKESGLIVSPRVFVVCLGCRIPVYLVSFWNTCTPAIKLYFRVSVVPVSRAYCTARIWHMCKHLLNHISLWLPISLLEVLLLLCEQGQTEHNPKRSTSNWHKKSFPREGHLMVYATAARDGSRYRGLFCPFKVEKTWSELLILVQQHSTTTIK